MRRIETLLSHRRTPRKRRGHEIGGVRGCGDRVWLARPSINWQQHGGQLDGVRQPSVEVPTGARFDEDGNATD